MTGVSLELWEQVRNNKNKHSSDKSTVILSLDLESFTFKVVLTYRFRSESGMTGVSLELWEQVRNDKNKPRVINQLSF